MWACGRRHASGAILFSFLLLLATPAPAQTFGPASVTDGDTIEVMGERVRLHGIDAPERTQTCADARGEAYACGEAAKQALSALIAGAPVFCRATGRDGYGRVLAVCSRDGIELGAAMVRQGWALAYVRYATDYAVEQAQAERDRRGLWQGSFQPPEDYRRARRAGGTGAVVVRQAQRGGCAIKGNVSAAGERIYHLPGGRFYERTRIDENGGERWFCSESEAAAAGWRRSMQ